MSQTPMSETQLFPVYASPVANRTIDELRHLIGEARDDGEHELVVSLLTELISREPEVPNFQWDLMHALRRVRRFDEADALCERCLAKFPNDMGFMLEWCRLPDLWADWNKSLSRRRQLLETHPLSASPEYVPFVTEQMLPLFELGWRDEARELMEHSWPDIYRAPGYYPLQVFFALETLLMYRHTIAYCEALERRFGPNAPIVEGANVPSMRAMAEVAIDNVDWVARYVPEVRLVSVGQNCLPFGLPVRWGLNRFGATDQELTPWDFGAFRATTSAEMIRTGFASMLDPANFYEGALDGGAPMMYHRPSGNHFFHERGRPSIGDNGEVFHRRLREKIETFKRICRGGPVLFIFAVVGPADLDPLIASLEPYFSVNPARLLIINVTDEVVPAMSHPSVTYRCFRYPHDYSWNVISDYSSDRGIAFELRIAEAIKSEMRRVAR